MATTMYFEKTISDAANPKNEKLQIEIGTSSYLGPHKLYIRVGDVAVLVEDEIAREFCESVQNAGSYLGILR